MNGGHLTAEGAGWNAFALLNDRNAVLSEAPNKTNFYARRDEALELTSSCKTPPKPKIRTSKWLPIMRSPDYCLLIF